ncbi:MAG: hypothetical protein IJM59_01710 [Proteobacteria bacterium]|nr:hypothetical protein [Pseudomonadota bacterium]
MSEDTVKTPDSSSVDMTIVFADLGPEDLASRHHRPECGFWRWAFADENMALSVRQLPKSVHIEKPICQDYSVFANHVFELHRMELESSAEPSKIERPNDVDDQVVECTPQFILRNIPKIERYYDLERDLNFDVADLPLTEATDMIDEMRQTHIGNIEFIDVQSVNFVNDFRNFLEEIFYLCPWDQITKSEPTEDSPWHIKNSTAKLTADLLSRKNTLFIFTEKGMTQVGMKAYKPRKEKDAPAEERPNFVRSYGPG